LFGWTPLHVGLREKPESAKHQGRADHLRGSRFDRIAVAPLDPLGQLHADERERRRGHQHPHRQARMHGAEPPVPDSAEGLENGAVEDVRAHRERRLEAEQEDQQRRHQRAAAHSRRADQGRSADP
jgi:hypothetical protein